jgi:signal transduction histidine kinase
MKSRPTAPPPADPHPQVTAGIDRLTRVFCWLLLGAAVVCPVSVAIAWPSLERPARVLLVLVAATFAVVRITVFNPVRRVRQAGDMLGSWPVYAVPAALATVMAMMHPIFLITVLTEYVACFLWAGSPARTIRMSAVHSALVLTALLRWALLGGDWLLLGFGAVPVVGASVSSVLIAELRHHLDERQRLIASLDASRASLAFAQHEAGVLKERQRISRDIHDTVAQDLVGVIRWLEHAELSMGRAEPGDGASPGADSLCKATELARSALAETRSIVAAQPPPLLAETGLGHALADLIRRTSAEADYHIELGVSGTTRELPIETTTALLRITQEGLNNVRRHARAHTVSINLQFHDDRVVVEVSDDGVGLRTDQVDSFAGHGLHWMRSRVRELGGSVSIANGAVSGTTVRAEVPA